MKGKKFGTMRQTVREEEMPVSPGPNASVPEIFSTKKVFFLNSYSGGRRSEIPHIETEYCRRDEVSRRLFHHNSDLCDCDCASDGCGGCIRRNKQSFFKFFVLGLSIALILLLFGSLSYNLTRNKVAEGSFEFEQTKWISHHHEYTNAETSNSGGNASTWVEIEPVLDLPVPVYQHTDDYDSDEDVRRLQYHLDANPDRIEPISVSPLTGQNRNSHSEVLIIYDGREPPRSKRSISSRSNTKRIYVKENRKPKRNAKSGSREFLLKNLNHVEEGMENFLENYFKKGRTVFQAFSLTTPSYSTPMLSKESSEDEEIEDELKNMFLNKGGPVNFNPVTSRKVQVTAETVETSTRGKILEETLKEKTVTSQTTDIITLENNFDNLKEDEHSDTETLSETLATEAVPEVEASTQQVMESLIENLRMDSLEGRDLRTWPLFHFSLPFSGLFDSSPQDRITAESPPLDTVRGISLTDAKKIKKEKRKHLLLNSRVVGGSSDVRLPTGPDVSKPFVNAFETLKTNQQLSFTPSAASQFILPYQMCLFAGPFQGPKPSAQGPQPRTFSFGAPPLFPSIFDKAPQPVRNPQVPTQQNFLSFSINNYPNAPSRSFTQPSTGSFYNIPSQQPFSLYPGPNKQPIFCTYLQPPLFQFPTVPGTADFSHAKCVDCEGESQKDVKLAKDIAFPSGRETLCAEEKVSCLDGSSCIPVGYWCDNQVHCKDASDEAFCSCRERVSKERLCDGYLDCPHGEDETACFDCPKSAFSCGSFVSPNSCIPLSKRCDGVRDCATGADESDCSAIFFQVRQNDSYHVSQVTGYLHRNWKGDWFPVCVELDDSTWAKEACAGELGVIPSDVEVKFAPVSTHYKGPFIVREGDGTIALQDHCKGHVSTYIICPPMNCGTRIEFYSSSKIYREENPFIRRSVLSRKDYAINEEAENLRLRREETGRVVGGRESEPKAWPWAIAVYKNGAFHCGGVILDENWVLTAAHCMEQYWKHYYEVRGGMLRRFSYSAMEQPRTVSHVIIHENYDLNIMSNDLALLRLKEPFHLNRWVRPACLPVLQDGISKFASGPAPGTRCTAVGWGALKERGVDPDQLREVEIPIMSRCKHKEDLVGEEICAGKLEGGKDTCQGDSGGPLLCRDSSIPASWYIAGIVSHGEGCARPGEPGAYTRISLFVDWITANTNDFQLPSVKPLQDCPGFRCRSATKLCIPRKWVCNGFTDCLEAEDERNCSDSKPESIFNRKYTGGDRFFGEGSVEGEKFGGILNTVGSQLQGKTKNRPEQQRSETTEGSGTVELVRENTAPLKTLKSSILRTTEPRFRPDRVERHTTQGLDSAESVSETLAPEKISDSLIMRETDLGFRLESSEKRPEESLKAFEVTRATTANLEPLDIFIKRTTERKFSAEITGSHVTEGSENVELVSETIAPQMTLMKAKERGIHLENIERHTTQSLREITHTDESTESVSSEKKYAEKYSGYEISTEGLLERTEKQSESYKRVSDGTQNKRTDEGGSEKAIYIVTNGGRKTTTREMVSNAENEGKLSEVTTETEPMEINSDQVKDGKTINHDESGSAEDNKESENAEREIFEKNYTRKDTTEDRKEKINRQKSLSMEEEERFSEVTYTEVVTEMENYEEEEKVYGNETTESVVTRTEEQESTSYKEYENGIGNENDKIKNPHNEKETTNKESTWESAEEGIVSIREQFITEGVVVETIKKEDTVTEGLATGQLSKIDGEKRQEDKSTSEEIEVSEEEHSTRYSDEKTEERNSFYLEVYTPENLLESSVSENTVETKEEEKVTEISTKAAEDIPVGGEVTEIHSIQTRETPETEINLEEYSTSSFNAATTDHRSRSNFDYFRCRQIVQSILPAYRCDGQEDCEDGTDEENCTCVEILQNLNPKHICDGRPHCPDHSDEKNCFKCRPNEFYCENSHECISAVERCDGMTDCTFGEDEDKCLSLGDSLNHFQTEGLMTVNKNGVWKAVCQEEGATYLGAGDAINVCSSLGTVGYERYENRSLGSNCTGFHVTCAKGLIRSVEKYKDRNGSYLWPWNGYLYSDGRFVCFGVLLRPRWVLTSSHCLQDISLLKNYITAKFSTSSKSKPIRIDGAHEISESNAVLLHLSEEVNQTESVRPLGMPYVFESDPEKDICVAVGDQTVFLKILKHCQENFRCYKKLTPTSSGCTSKPWAGVIVCQSRFGWYPSSIYSEKLGYCGFRQANFTSLRDNIRDVMGKKVSVFSEPVCHGFRCSQGPCIPLSMMCDGKSDCSDEEDESFGLCTSKKYTKECKITELRCRSGRCIPKILFGDGIPDCEDGSDEPSDVTCVEYLRLTDPERVCDGKRNCYDKTDEDYKICSCDDSKFQCKLSGYCVPKDLVCDGEKDCPGGEDEEQCTGRKIVKNHTKAHLEVMQKSYGIWHTMCPTHMSKQRSDAFCRDLGFKEALDTYQRNQTVILPETDPFSWVKLNTKTSIGLRGNKPFVRLVTSRKTCHSVKCA